MHITKILLRFVLVVLLVGLYDFEPEVFGQELCLFFLFSDYLQGTNKHNSKPIQLRQEKSNHINGALPWCPHNTLEHADVSLNAYSIIED